MPNPCPGFCGGAESAGYRRVDATPSSRAATAAKVLAVALVVVGALALASSFMSHHGALGALGHVFGRTGAMVTIAAGLVPLLIAGINKGSVRRIGDAIDAHADYPYDGYSAPLRSTGVGAMWGGRSGAVESFDDAHSAGGGGGSQGSGSRGTRVASPYGDDQRHPVWEQ